MNVMILSKKIKYEAYSPWTVSMMSSSFMRELQITARLLLPSFPERQ